MRNFQAVSPILINIIWKRLVMGRNGSRWEKSRCELLIHRMTMLCWRNLWQAAICVSQTCTYLPGSFLFRGFVFLVKRISLHQVWWTHGMDCVI